ncbi:hypothetical protein NL676_028683 [Syzygium grande]|nr:hypothetical protein NL676_028683 [Syzygium grande]
MFPCNITDPRFSPYAAIGPVDFGFEGGREPSIRDPGFWREATSGQEPRGGPRHRAAGVGGVGGDGPKRGHVRWAQWAARGRATRESYEATPSTARCVAAGCPATWRPPGHLFAPPLHMQVS